MQTNINRHQYHANHPSIHSFISKNCEKHSLPFHYELQISKNSMNQIECVRTEMCLFVANICLNKFFSVHVNIFMNV